MLNNLKFLGVIMLSMLLLTNCTKDNKKVDTKAPGELVFAALDGGTEKSDYDVLCDESLVIDHAYVVLNGVEYNPLTFVLDGVLYTQSLKLDPGVYTIDEFILMTVDNIPVKATPMFDSQYAEFVNTPLGDPDFPAQFTIEEFQKSEFDIEVLCYVPSEFDNFGFEWFEISQLTVYTQCFFGDICIDDLELYSGSYYGPIVTVDEVAIYKIVVLRDDVEMGTYANTGWSENNMMTFESPLCIEYADYDNQVNNFEFQLWIYVNTGVNDQNVPTFGYVNYYNWEFTDNYMIPAGNDGVVDFVLGDCVWEGSDLTIGWPN
jgi:hypothetical protein